MSLTDEPDDDGLDDQPLRLSVEILLDLDGENQAEIARPTPGDLIREFGISQRTVDYYRSQGILTVEGTSELPVFSPSVANRFRIVLLARKMGFSVADAIAIAHAYD